MVAMNVVKTVTVVGRQQGVDAVTASLDQQEGAFAKLLAAVAANDRATLSAGRALERHSNALDVDYRNVQKLEQITHDLTRAQQQGLVTQERVNELLTLAATRFSTAGAAAAQSGQQARQGASGWQYFSTAGLKDLANDNAARRIGAMGNAAVDAGDKAAKGTRRANAEMQNMTYQLNDIAVSLASGQSPFTVIMQQGMQMAQIFGPTVGVGGAIKSVGVALKSFLLNPLTLTVGAIAATAAAAQFLFSSSDSGGQKVERTLKNQAGTLREIRDLYLDAGRGIQDMASQSERVLRMEAQAALTRRQADVREKTSGALSGIYDRGGFRQTAETDALGNVVGSSVESEDAVRGRFAPFKAQIDDLRKSLRAGAPDLARFREEVAKRIEASPELRYIGDELREMTEGADEAARGLPALRAAVEGVNGALEGNPFASYADGVGKLIDMIPRLKAAAENAKLDETIERAFRDSKSYADRMVAEGKISPAQADAQTREARRRADELQRNRVGGRSTALTPEEQARLDHDIALQAIRARSIADRVALAGARRSRELAGRTDISPEQRGLEIERAKTEELARATEDLARADRERTLSLREQFAAGQASIAMQGANVASLEAERFKREELARISREEAANGPEWARKEREGLDDLANAWGRLQQQIAAAKVAQDAIFDRQQMGRGDSEREIYSRLQSAGLLQNGQIADEATKALAAQLRLNQQLERTRDLAKSQFETRQRFRDAAQDIDLQGAGVREMEAARYARDKMNEVDRQAFANGPSWNAWASERRAAILKEADAWGRLQERAAQANLVRDLRFEGQQAGRSEGDQAIYARMNSAGLLDRNGEISGETNLLIAAQLRHQQQVQATSEAYRGLGETMATALMSGEKPAKAMLLYLGQMAGKEGTKLVGDAFAQAGAWMSGKGPMGGKTLGAGDTAALANTAVTVPLMTVTAANVQIMGAGVTGMLGGQPLGVPSLGLSGGIPQGGMAAGNVLSFSTAGGGQYADMIRNAAMRYGIDPEVALRVAKSEGGTNGWIQSGVMKNGLREPSYGPFQMLVGGKGTGFPEGLGNNLLRQGIDPRNPAYAPQTIDYAMKHASENGWGAWYGAKAAGIGNRQGIGQPPLDTAALQQQFAGLQTATQQAAAAIPTMAQGAAQAAPALGGVADQASGLGGMFQNLFSGLGGAAGGSGGAGGLGSLISGAMSFVPKLFGFSEGGIMTSRGRLPLRAYSGGGVASSPQLAMFGEGSVPEAYVPVPSGKIPVEMNIPMPKVPVPAAAPRERPSVTFGGTQITVQGSMDDKAASNLKRELDQRDRRLLEQMNSSWREAG